MKPLPFVSRIRAANGCALYFPMRKKDKLVSGFSFTTRRWGEEWIHVALEPVRIEVRLEGDNAIPMGDNLRADFVAKLIARIDDETLEQSIDRLVKRFRCSLTTDLNEILRESFFRPKIDELFLENVYQSLKKASYEKLLSQPGHSEEIDSDLRDLVVTSLRDVGFRMVECRISYFVPVKPTEVGVAAHVARKWLEIDKEQMKLDAEKDFQKSEMAEEVKRRTALSREKTEQEDRAAKLREEDAKKEFEKEKKAIDIETAEIKKEKGIESAKIDEEAKECNRRYQEVEREYLAEQKRKERTEEIELQRFEKTEQRKLEVDEENHALDMRQRRLREEQEKLEHNASMRKRKLDELKEEMEFAQLRKDVAAINIEIEKSEKGLELELSAARSKIDLDRLESKARIDNISKADAVEAESKTLRLILEKMPSILASLPVEKERIGETTLIQVSGAQDVDGATSKAAVTAGIYAPLVRDIITLFSGGLFGGGSQQRGKNSDNEEREVASQESHTTTNNLEQEAMGEASSHTETSPKKGS